MRGPVGPSVRDPEGHRVERPERPDGVRVADDEQRLAAAVQLRHEVVAFEADARAMRREVRRDASAWPVGDSSSPRSRRREA
jgi:hypothetical protein